jgi:glutamate N-acetyltransferase/amino-acid N-acetyltransferase
MKGVLMTHSIPKGFRLAGVYSGVKRNPDSNDLTLLVCDERATAAGVYTTNLICAAPVTLDRARTPSDNIRVVVVNSGNANACTGDQGDRDAQEMVRLAAEACGASEDQALVMSTGIIGEHLSMEKIATGITAAADVLGTNDESLIAAARGIITTDKDIKLASRPLTLGGREYQVTGMAKGAGMIGPKMATMLGIVMTDAPLTPTDAQTLLTSVADETFNCISVEGHTSTNDTVLLLASGAAGGPPLAGDDLAALGNAVTEVCTELARAIPTDGEGASHLITLDVCGCADREDARTIARTIADSPLVKTAATGNDPNWGRIVSAAGYAGVPFDPAKVGLSINGTMLYKDGAPIEFDAAAVSTSMRENFETHIRLQLGEGDAQIRFYTSDLTVEYIHINADYHT